VTGKPKLNIQIGLSNPSCQNEDVLWVVDGDIGPTSSATTYGPYEFFQPDKSLFMGWQLLLDPY
jgi:hypothetical protein